MKDNSDVIKYYIKENIKINNFNYELIGMTLQKNPVYFVSLFKTY